MRGEKFCYYHHETRKPVADARERQARRNSFELPKPTSRAAIQDSLGQINSRIAYNDIDPRRAGLLLYALQIASTNLKDHQNNQQISDPVIPTEAPEARSGGIRFSTDAAFEAEVFPPHQLQLRPIRRETAAALIESLARHHGVEPSPGFPEDRRPEPESAPD